MAKMKMTYTPEGGSRREWSFDSGNPPWDVAFNTEKSTDWPWSVFSDKLGDGSVIALRALIWTLRKRDEPRLDIEGVQVTWGEVDVDVECDRCGQVITDPDHDCGVPVQEESDPEA